MSISTSRFFSALLVRGAEPSLKIDRAAEYSLGPVMSSLGTLYRYFIAANKMRIRFDKTFANPEVVKRFADADPLTRMTMVYVDDFGVFMSYWYSGLYVVIEGYRELQLKDREIDALLQSPNVDALRLFRNATFHFQTEFFSPKIIHFIGSADSVPWVRSLTEAFSEFFLA